MASGSVTAAADRLNLTQSAISKQLLSLEQQLKIQLFDRRSGSVMVPTRDGVAFYKAIEGTISALNELGTIARDIAQHARQRLRLAATPPLMNSHVVMMALRRFLAAHPDIQVSLEPRHRLDIEDWVAHRQIDAALALLPAANPGLRAVPLINTQAVAVLVRDHPLASHESLDPVLLTGQRIILPSHQPLRTQIEAVLSEQGLTLPSALQSASAITCCRLASENFGIAICDPFSPTAFSSKDLVIRRWTPAVGLTYGVLLNPEAKVTETTATFLRLLEEEFRALQGFPATTFPEFLKPAPSA